jgi:protein gp37
MGQAHRFSGPGKPFAGLTVIRNDRVDWSGEARFVPDALAEPLSWRRPSLIFVNSMSDLFHHSITNEEIAAVFGVMAACPQHVFQVLTKRPERMREWFEWLSAQHEDDPYTLCLGNAARYIAPARWGRVMEETGLERDLMECEPWPLPNVWLGVSAEDQQRWDERKHFIHDVPAAVHFASFEPLLGPIDLKGTGRLHLGWAIVGGESGPRARKSDAAWTRDLVQECWDAGIPVFHKQMGANVWDRNDIGFDGETEDEWPDGTETEIVGEDPNRRWQGAPLRIFLKDKKGADPSEWPEALRVQQLPPIPFERSTPESRVETHRYRILWQGRGIWSVDAESPEKAVDLAVNATGRPSGELSAHLEDSPVVTLARAGRVTTWKGIPEAAE